MVEPGLFFILAHTILGTRIEMSEVCRELVDWVTRIEMSDFVLSGLLPQSPTTFLGLLPQSPAFSFLPHGLVWVGGFLLLNDGMWIL